MSQNEDVKFKLTSNYVTKLDLIKKNLNRTKVNLDKALERIDALMGCRGKAVKMIESTDKPFDFQFDAISLEGKSRDSFVALGTIASMLSRMLEEIEE